MKFATDSRSFDYNWEGLPIFDSRDANVWLARYHGYLKDGDALQDYRKKVLFERHKEMFDRDSKRRDMNHKVVYHGIPTIPSDSGYSIVHAEVEFPAPSPAEALLVLGMSQEDVARMMKHEGVAIEGFLDDLRKTELSPDDFTASDFPSAVGSGSTLKRFCVCVLDNAQGHYSKETGLMIYFAEPISSEPV